MTNAIPLSEVRRHLTCGAKVGDEKSPGYRILPKYTVLSTETGSWRLMELHMNTHFLGDLPHMSSTMTGFPTPPRLQLTPITRGSLPRHFSTPAGTVGASMAVALETLVSKIPSCFEIAKSAGDLIFYPSTVNKHVDCGVEFEIRLCPALQKKPTLPNPHFDVPSERVPTPVDPFAPPYTPHLLIGECRDEEEGVEYALLLNKYSLVPHHIILATKQYQSQASPLFPCDLVQAYSLLLEAQKAGRRYFAFYNCGDNSGASRPHKHIQLIPLSEGVDASPIERLAKAATLQAPNKPFTLAPLPYANHVFRLSQLSLSTPRPQLEQALSSAFISLLDLVISTVRHDPDHPAGPPSYNVLLTLEHIHLIPRRREGYVLPSGQKLSVNSLGFAGMLMVKSEEELQAVKSQGIGKILRGVALESVHDLQVLGTSVDLNVEGKL